VNFNVVTYYKAIGSGYLSMAATSAVGLIMTPFILTFLTRDEFAIYYISADIIIWLGIVQLGVSPTLTSLMGQYIGASRSDRLPALMGTALVLQIVSALMVFLIGFAISNFLNYWFNPQQQIEGLQLMFLILVLNFAISLLMQVYSGFFIANKQIHIDNLIRILVLIPSIVLTILFLKSGLKLLGLALTGLVTAIINLIIGYLRFKYQFPESKFSVTLFNSSDAKLLLRNGVWLSLGGIAGILIFNLDKFIIGKMISLAAVANFIITFKLYSISEKVLAQVVNASRPYLAQIFGQGNFEKLYQLYSFLTVFSLLGGGFIATVIFWGNKYFIDWWVGPKFYMGDKISLLMAVNFFLQFAVLPNRALLASTFFKIRAQNSIRFIEGILNLFLSILLINIFSVEGVIVASILSTLVLSNIILNSYCIDFFRERNVHVRQRIILPYFVILIPVFLYVINELFPAMSTMASFLILSFIFVSFLIFIWIYIKKSSFKQLIFVSLKHSNKR